MRVLLRGALTVDVCQVPGMPCLHRLQGHIPIALSRLLSCSSQSGPPSALAGIPDGCLISGSEAAGRKRKAAMRRENPARWALQGHGPVILPENLATGEHFLGSSCLIHKLISQQSGCERTVCHRATSLASCRVTGENHCGLPTAQKQSSPTCLTRKWLLPSLCPGMEGEARGAAQAGLAPLFVL